MKLSTRARYALRMMQEITRQSNGEKLVSVNAISEKTGISRRYLEQLAIALKKRALIKGVKGKGGGYALNRPASEISIGQIIESAIGNINIVECVGTPDACIKADICECRWVYQVINSRITEVLRGISLAELSDGEQLMKIAQDIAPDISCCA